MALLTNEEKKQRVRQRVRVRMEEGTYETYPETIRTDHYQSDKYQRVAIYARVSTDDVSQTTSLNFRRSITKTLLRSIPNGSWLVSMPMKASAEHQQRNEMRLTG